MIGQIPGFLGGKSTSTYDRPENQTFATARDLNIFGEVNVLTSQIKLINDAGKHTDFKPYNSYRGSNNIIYFLGEQTIAATAYTILYSTGAVLSASGTYTEVDKVAGVGTTFPLEEFKGSLWWGRGATLRKYTNFTGAPASSGATITDGVDILKPHLGLGKLFYVHNSQRTIGWTDDSTYTNSALVLDNADKIVSLDVYGQFLLIGVKDVNRSRNSRILIWDGSAITVDDIMQMSTPDLLGFRVIGSTIRALVGNDKVFTIYDGGIGGELKPVYTIPNSNSAGSLSMYDTALSVSHDILYWGLSPASAQTLELGVFAYGSDQTSKPARFNLDRLVHTGATSSVKITSVRNNGSYMIVTWFDGSNVFYINHSYTANSGSSTNGVYETPRIRLHPYKKAKLKWLKIPHKTLPASTAYTVKVIHFGTYFKGNTSEVVETFAAATAYTQNTANTTFSLIEDGDLTFKYCDEIQIQIALTTVSGTSAPEIIFPISYETEELN